MDLDTTSTKWSHHRILERVARGEVDILLGTQMIAKGLDFPRVTVVGVVDADTGLHLPDFRAGERTFQLVAQVAGRAGRGPAGGRVVVQTRAPGPPRAARGGGALGGARSPRRSCRCGRPAPFVSAARRAGAVRGARGYRRGGRGRRRPAWRTGCGAPAPSGWSGALAVLGPARLPDSAAPRPLALARAGEGGGAAGAGPRHAGVAGRRGGGSGRRPGPGGAAVGRSRCESLFVHVTLPLVALWSLPE